MTAVNIVVYFFWATLYTVGKTAVAIFTFAIKLTLSQYITAYRLLHVV